MTSTVASWGGWAWPGQSGIDPNWIGFANKGYQEGLVAPVAGMGASVPTAGLPAMHPGFHVVRGDVGWHPPVDRRGQIPYEQLDQELMATLSEVAMTEDDFALVAVCLEELRVAASRVGPQLKISAFGSIATGLARHGSDLDATCFKETSDGVQFTVMDLQLKILLLLKESGRFEVIEEIWQARVPIVKLRFDKTLDVDLSWNNEETLANTQLLRAYVEMDKKVQHFAILVKVWATCAGVSGAVKGNLSSYAFTLMVIYYLQVDENVKMPVLPTHLFTEGERQVKANKDWSCSLTRAELLQRFFYFYTHEFAWGKEVVSVRVGRRNMVDDPVFSKLAGTHQQRIHIEDPFLLNRNLHCVLRPEQETVLYKRLCAANERTSVGMAPEGLRGVLPCATMAPPGNVSPVLAPLAAALAGKGVPYNPLHGGVSPVTLPGQTPPMLESMTHPHFASSLCPTAQMDTVAASGGLANDGPAKAVVAVAKKGVAKEVAPVTAAGKTAATARDTTTVRTAAKGKRGSGMVVEEFGGFSIEKAKELRDMAPKTEDLPMILLKLHGVWSL